MKIIFLTQYYPPEIGAPQRRLAELAERLIQAGHSVTVLTAMPNYPHGCIHAGYGGIFQRETINGVQVIRTAIYPTQSAAFIHRLLNYFSFVMSSVIIGTVLLQEADFLLVESPPLFLGLSAIWLSLIKRTRLIFNVSDLWPESAVQLNVVRRNSRIHRLSNWLEALCYQCAWLITGQSREILRDIRRRFPQKATFRLSNGVDVERFGDDHFDAAVRARLGAPHEIIAVYAGLHGLAQGLAQLLHVAHEFRDENRLKIVLIGTGPKKRQLVHMANELGLHNIEFRDPIPAEAVPRVLASADIALVTLKSYIPGAVPSKLYEAMASRKPVILVANGEAADIVQGNGAGLVVEPDDIDGLAQAFRKLLDDPGLREELGANGRAAAIQHFNREKIVNDFIAYLENQLQ